MTTKLERLPKVSLRRADSRAHSVAREYVALGIVLLSAAAFNAITLFRYPRPLIDEVELVGRAWSYVLTGFNVAPFTPAVDPANLVVTPAPVQLLGTWLFTIPVRVFGVNLWTVRMESLAFGLVLLVAVYFIGRKLYGWKVGLLATGLVAFSNGFVTSSHIARYDMMISLVGFSAVALVLHDGGPGIPMRSVLAGLLLGLSFEMHGNAALYGPPIVLLLFVEQGSGLLRSKRLYAFVVGVCVGLLFYVMLHLLPHPGSGAGGVSNLVLSSEGLKRPPITFLDPEVWLESFEDTVVSIVSFEQWRAFPLAAALVALGFHRTKSDISLLAIFATLFAEWIAVLSYKPFYYGILISPIIDLIVAAAFLMFWNGLRGICVGPAWPGRTTRRVALAVLGVYAGLLMVSVAGVATSQFERNAFADYEKTNAGLRLVLPAGARLVGDHTLWFGLSDYRWVAWPYLPIELQKSPGSSIVDAYRALGGDYLVVGPDILWNVTDDPSDRPYWARWQNISKNDWDSFIARYGELVTSVTTQSLGKVSVYRIRAN